MATPISLNSLIRWAQRAPGSEAAIVASTAKNLLTRSSSLRQLLFDSESGINRVSNDLIAFSGIGEPHR